MNLKSNSLANDDGTINAEHVNPHDVLRICDVSFVVTRICRNYENGEISNVDIYVKQIGSRQKVADLLAARLPGFRFQYVGDRRLGAK